MLSPTSQRLHTQTPLLSRLERPHPRQRDRLRPGRRAGCGRDRLAEGNATLSLNAWRGGLAIARATAIGATNRESMYRLAPPRPPITVLWPHIPKASTRPPTAIPIDRIFTPVVVSAPIIVQRRAVSGQEALDLGSPAPGLVGALW